MGERHTFVIVGAGIAGLTAALALAAKGFAVVVFERSEKLSEIGAGIQISPNAGRILADLGLEKAMAVAAIEPRAIDIHDGPAGRLITSLQAEEFRNRFDFPYRIIHRADLQSILAKAVERAGVRLALSATAESFVSRPDGLLVRARKPGGGADVVAASAVIAADGVWSLFRNKIPDSARPVATGRTAWRTIISSDIARDLVATDRVGLWLGPNAHLVHYPVAQGAAVNVVAIVKEAWDRQGWSAPGRAVELAPHFAQWSGKARAILGAPASWQKFAVLALDGNGPWVFERLALIGDAAHAMPPFLAQGAAAAIEDAAVLADTLYGAADVPAALAVFAEARRPRVTRMAAAAKRNGDRYHYRGIMALARNTALRFAGPRFILGDNAWIYGWRPSQQTETAR